MMTEVFETKVCETHGEFQAKVMSTMGHTFYSKCPGCTKYFDDMKEKQEADRKANELKASIERAKASSKIPPRFARCSFDNFRISNEGQEKALTVAKAYTDDWTQANADGRCLIFSGKAGTGKTHLACAIANELIEQGTYAKFYTVTGLLRRIKECFAKESKETESEMIDNFSHVELLILDEAGMDYGTEFNKTLMFEVLNRRYENMNPTIVITNLDMGALKEYFGDRILDRMREGGGKLVSFNWESQRK
jgi:DNA replication protein DnaC